ncbi:MAG TPA: hypothetical protein PKD20_01330 [Candidatus Saccharibacteria bacterium]|nr:hypothetical protein [Candidatus Saccharibacteria bacterium]
MSRFIDGVIANHFGANRTSVFEADAESKTFHPHVTVQEADDPARAQQSLISEYIRAGLADAANYLMLNAVEPTHALVSNERGRRPTLFIPRYREMSARSIHWALEDESVTYAGHPTYIMKQDIDRHVPRYGESKNMLLLSASGDVEQFKFLGERQGAHENESAERVSPEFIGHFLIREAVTDEQLVPLKSVDSSMPIELNSSVIYFQDRVSKLIEERSL